jgi:hypothetical protein
VTCPVRVASEGRGDDVGPGAGELPPSPSSGRRVSNPRPSAWEAERETRSRGISWGGCDQDATGTSNAVADCLADQLPHLLERTPERVRVVREHRLHGMAADRGKVGVVNSGSPQKREVRVAEFVRLAVKSADLNGRVPDVAIEVPLAEELAGRRWEQELGVDPRRPVDKHHRERRRAGHDATGDGLSMVRLRTGLDLPLMGGPAHVEVRGGRRRRPRRAVRPDEPLMLPLTLLLPFSSGC